ncbi:FG-GAP repeat protein [Melioribacter roseus P3M-2]|uniref:FG-GAP repeat protein n=1 Tax=Melioribacter roseus (strain DSM 23840 / JCM 17771 / VKM B-2668 / P3M-2) TaxID=1191523 RepID=I6ZU66_MELRP|nr:T9SS type A sorting domain-containing protein [Melioribacter roseus]AFN75554.1 FG-GAP repeat protein [Melioribacter roseus P3M-2]
MKTRLFIVLFVVFSSLSFAQNKDTVDVIPGFNTLSEQIESDIQRGVDVGNRVYRLANGQPYLLDHTMEINFPLTLICPDGEPALVQAAKDINGSSPSDLFHIYKDVYVENIAFSGVDNGGAVRLRVFVLQTDSLTAEAHKCIFELARLNVFSSNGLYAKIKFTNCIFNNCLTDNNLYNGRAFDDRQNVVESFYAENCSFINMRSPIHFWGTLVKNYYVNHCTFYNTTMYVRGFSTGVNVTFTNNNLVNTGIYPIAFNPATNVDTAEGFQVPGVVDVDTLSHELASEDQKKWTVKNNNYYFSQNVLDFFSSLDDTLVLRPWISSHDSAFAAKYPQRYDIEVALSENPNFINAPQTDTLIKWIGLYLSGERSTDKLPDTRFLPDGYVDENGIAYLAYKYYDFSYDKNNPLYSAGTDGKPIGDLQWFQNITSVERVTDVIPTNIKLNQNYPNPFNPTTNITYELPKQSNVTITVYNSLGQEVIRLVNNEMQSAGTYKITWSGKDAYGNSLASGIYYYQLNTDDVVLSKKMILLK